MATIESIFNKLPPETQKIFRGFWDSLPSADRKNFETLLQGFPSQASLVRMLINLTTAQIQLTFGRLRHVAIVGPANVGKSTLYNQLVRRKEDEAEVGPLPGTTRTRQQADAGIFAVVDTPGADTVGVLGEKEQAEAYAAAHEADFLIILFDAIQGVKKTELEIFERLVELGKPYVVAMNKIDLVRKSEKKVIEQAAAALKLEPDQVVPVVAKNGANLDKLLIAIAVTEPQIVAALGRALPQYRWQLAWRAIVSAATISAVIALTPLPVLDFGPLVVTQAMMVLAIARIYNYQINLQRARELVAAFGMAFLGRTIFQEVSKLGGVPGWVLSAAIATSTTVVMGFAAVAWFDRGERLSNDTLKKMTEQVTRQVLDALRSLGKQKPDKASLEQTITQVLEQSPLAEKPDALQPPEE